MASARTAFLGYQTGLARAFYLLSPDYRQHTAPACRAIHDTGSLRGTRLSAAPRIIPANLHRPIYFFIDRIAAACWSGSAASGGTNIEGFSNKRGTTCSHLQEIFYSPHTCSISLPVPLRIRNCLLEMMADLAGVLGAWNTPWLTLTYNFN